MLGRKEKRIVTSSLNQVKHTVEIEIYPAPKEWSIEGMLPRKWRYTAIISDNIFMSGSKDYSTPYDAITAGLESAREYQFQDEKYVNPVITTYTNDNDHYSAIVKRDNARKRRYSK